MVNLVNCENIKVGYLKYTSSAFDSKIQAFLHLYFDS